jgi:hypothetical protein
MANGIIKAAFPPPVPGGTNAVIVTYDATSSKGINFAHKAYQSLPLE